MKFIPFTAHSDARERAQFAEVAALKDLSSRHVVRYGFALFWLRFVWFEICLRA